MSTANEWPIGGQPRVSNELKKRGIFVLPRGVGGIWQRQNLEIFEKWLIALGRESGKSGFYGEPASGLRKSLS
jgi:hypothetical protein